MRLVTNVYGLVRIHFIAEEKWHRQPGALRGRRHSQAARMPVGFSIETAVDFEAAQEVRAAIPSPRLAQSRVAQGRRRASHAHDACAKNSSRANWQRGIIGCADYRGHEREIHRLTRHVTRREATSDDSTRVLVHTAALPGLGAAYCSFASSAATRSRSICSCCAYSAAICA